MLSVGMKGEPLFFFFLLFSFLGSREAPQALCFATKGLSLQEIRVFLNFALRTDVFDKFMRFWIVIVRRTDAPETNHQSSLHAVTPFGDKLSGAVQTPIKFERYGACTRVCREHTVAH